MRKQKKDKQVVKKIKIAYHPDRFEDKKSKDAAH